MVGILGLPIILIIFGEISNILFDKNEWLSRFEVLFVYNWVYAVEFM